MRATKIALIFISIFFLSLIVSSAQGQNKGPETMNLKERFNVSGSKSAVIFKHQYHQEKLGQQCLKCHENTDGGGKIRFELSKLTGISNDFHKNFCWPCHEEMNVPKGKSCSTCHK